MKNQMQDSVMAQSSKKPKQAQPEKPYVPTNKERSKIYSKAVPQEKRIAREENKKSKILSKASKKLNNDPFLKKESEYYKQQSEGYKQSAKKLDSTAKSIKRQK